MPDLSRTSVPGWAVAAGVHGSENRGRELSLYAVGEASFAFAESWSSELSRADAAPPVELRRFLTASGALDALATEMTGATVGWRLAITGSADSSMALRAMALAMGMSDDEIQVASTDCSERSVFCSHCRGLTVTDAPIGGVTSCSGCGRSLMIYAHVSRRRGHFLGFMADAEER